jgi:hypothetical protein
MGDLGSYVWFVGLGGGILVLALVLIYGSTRRRRAGGRPNAAWEQAAAESGHPEVAKTDGTRSGRP